MSGQSARTVDPALAILAIPLVLMALFLAVMVAIQLACVGFVGLIWFWSR